MRWRSKRVTRAVDTYIGCWNEVMTIRHVYRHLEEERCTERVASLCRNKPLTWTLA